MRTMASKAETSTEYSIHSFLKGRKRVFGFVPVSNWSWLLGSQADFRRETTLAPFHDTRTK